MPGGDGSDSGVGRTAELLSQALIREYLAKRGYRDTLSCFDREEPRDEETITSRSAVAKGLHLEKVVRHFKSQAGGPSTILEMLSAYLAAQRGPVSVSVLQRGETDEKEKGKESGRSVSRAAKAEGGKTRVDEDDRRLLDRVGEPSVPRGMRDPHRDQDQDQHAKASMSATTGWGAPSGTSVGRTASLNNRTAGRSGGEMALEDVADEDLDVHDLSLTAPVPSASRLPSAGDTFSFHTSSHTVGMALARELRELMMGKEAAARGDGYPPSFKQGFYFKSYASRDGPGEVHSFGLWQEEGGPCGVIAAVQAEVIRELAAGPAGKKKRASLSSSSLGSTADAAAPASVADRVLNASPTERDAALYAALASILWRCGGGRRACVAIPDPSRASQSIGAFSSSSSSSSSSYGGRRGDGVTEGLTVYEFDTLVNLRRFLVAASSALTSPDGWGVLLLMYSAMISRGLDAIRDVDLDPMSEGRMLGKHGYCTQEVVNLLMTGRATANVFDGERDAGGCVLRGVDCGQCEVGFLTLFEHFGGLEVGQALKNPSSPVWVVQSESHYSVAFATDATAALGMSAPAEFDLYYYDQLARQDERVRISVRFDPRRPAVGLNPRRTADSDPDSSIEQVIRTRWKGAALSWNGTDPIL